jgi:hypothetical protein
MPRTTTYKKILTCSFFLLGTHYAMENNIMVPITDYKQIQSFTGKVVAYSTTSQHLSSSSQNYYEAIQLPEAIIKYGFISTEESSELLFSKKSEDESYYDAHSGYKMLRLINTKKAPEIKFLAIVTIDQAQLCMREITQEEAQDIIDKINTNKKAFGKRIGWHNQECFPSLYLDIRARQKK